MPTQGRSHELSMTGTSLTVCILSKDEEANIRRALASARRIATELLVVDTGSSDGTVEVAESMGATVIHHAWSDDFAEARNVGLDHATCEWVLMLDADEAIGPTAPDLIAAMLSDPCTDGYFVRVTNVLSNGQRPSYPVLRMFRNKPEYRYVGRVHEQIVYAIESNGGRLKNSSLLIEHYGYTEEEDRRKGRRERNRNLLRLTLEENPDSSYHWHHLGHELMMNDEFGEAADCLSKSLRLSQRYVHSHRAAHLLVQIGLLRNRLDHGWELASMGRNQSITRWDSTLCMLRVALYEGDYVAAQGALSSLQQATPSEYGLLSRSPASLAQLRAATLWAAGQQEAAIASWEAASSQFPDEPSLAIEWVRHLVVAKGLQSAVIDARSYLESPRVQSAVVGALLRAGQLDMAEALSVAIRRLGYNSTYLLYGLGRRGLWPEVHTYLESSGVGGAVALATAAVWFDRPDILQTALGCLPKSWRKTFEQIVALEQVSSELLWAADLLMAHWADVGCLELLRAGAHCIDNYGGIGRAAWLLLKAGLPSTAQQWARERPDIPDSLEVLGLTAFDNGDYESAGHFLSRRIEWGPARVILYHHAALALQAQQASDRARTVIECGRRYHPWSPLLQSVQV